MLSRQSARYVLRQSQNMRQTKQSLKILKYLPPPHPCVKTAGVSPNASFGVKKKEKKKKRIDSNRLTPWHLEPHTNIANGKAEYKEFESLNESQALYVKVLVKKPTVYIVDITEQMKQNSTSSEQSSLTCLYNGTNMFAVLLQWFYHAGSGSHFDSMNKFLAFITHSETSLSSTTSMTASKASIHHIITYIQNRTWWSYLPDAALMCPFSFTDAPLFPNFVGRTQWRAEIIREKAWINARTREV